MSQYKFPKQYKKYLEASLIKGPQYFEYEDYLILINNQAIDRYQIVQKIGRGKYSDVYKAIVVGKIKEEDKLSVLKILKPIRQGKIKRQIKILKTLKHPSVIELENVMLDTCSNSYILAFDYVETQQDKRSPQYTDQQIRYFIYKILEGLNHCHSQGIMHRDIKPQNVLIDQKRKILKIVDWGLADYYLPNKEYNVRVASRYYKGPQLLVNNKFYDYSLDIWSLGCMFAGMIFKINIFFKGDDNPDQLRKIAQVMGTADIERYIQKYKLRPDQKAKEYIEEKTWSKRKLQDFISSDNKHLAHQKALDLLKKMLVVDHRITALQALSHPYFDLLQKQ